MSASVKLVGDADSNWDSIPENQNHTIATRLIGIEDIHWDMDGTGEKSSFIDRTGTEREITKINASHVPLPVVAREACNGAPDIAAGLVALKGLIGSGVSGGSGQLAKNTEVTVSANLTAQQRQSLIDEQNKNLGGHTLTIQFLEAIDLAFNTSLIFEGFYNGTLKIDLNGIKISDAANLTQLFQVRDNYCKVWIANGTMQHSSSTYAIVAERCPALYLDTLEFIASGAAANYALRGFDVDGFINNCTVIDDKMVELYCLQLEMSAAAAQSLVNSAVSAHNGVADSHSALFDGKADTDHVHTADKVGADAAGTATATVAAHDIGKNVHTGILAPLDSPEFTGIPKSPTAAVGTNSTQIATTAFVQEALTDSGVADATVADHNKSGTAHSTILAPLASPVFSGTPKAPTAVEGTDSEQVATTEFVQNAIVSNTVITERITNAVHSHNIFDKAHETLFNAKADAKHTHTASNIGADAAGTAGRAVSAHNIDDSAHIDLFKSKSNMNHTHLPAAVGADAIGTAASVVASHNDSETAHANMMKNFVPAGVIFPYAGNGGIPNGFFLCDGRPVNRTDYAALFKAIGTVYGIGDGTTTFNIPDFRGVFLRGYQNGISAPIGKKQAEGLPNITGTWAGSVQNDWTNHYTGAFYLKTDQSVTVDRGDSGSAKKALGFDASRSNPENPIYGQNDHVTPVNFAVQFIIKY